MSRLERKVRYIHEDTVVALFGGDGDLSTMPMGEVCIDLNSARRRVNLAQHQAYSHYAPNEQGQQLLPVLWPDAAAGL